MLDQCPLSAGLPSGVTNQNKTSDEYSSYLKLNSSAECMLQQAISPYKSNMWFKLCLIAMSL